MAKQKHQFIKGLILGCLFGGLILGLILFVITGTNIIQAQEGELGTLGRTAGYKKVDLITVVGNIIKVFLGLLGVIGVCLIIYGGLVWMTAGGSDDKILKAKKIIKNTIIGLIIILLAYAIVAFIMSKVGGALVEQYETCTPGVCTGCHQICNAQGTGSNYTEGCLELCGSLPGSSFVVKWVDPKDQETDVALCRAIQVGFNDVLDPETVKAQNILIKIKEGVRENESCAKNKDCASGECEALRCVGSTVAGTFKVAEEVFQFRAAKDFEENTVYQVEITTNVKSKKNLAINATDPKRKWIFSTGNETDTIPPQVTKVYPKDKDTEVCLRAPIEAIFNEPMDAISLKDTKALSIDPTVAAGFRPLPRVDVLIANPLENYQKNTKYTPLLNSNIIADSCGNLLDGNANGKPEKSPIDDYAPPPVGQAPDWSFTTGTTEYCTPKIEEIVPSSEYYDGGLITIRGNYFTLAGGVIFSNNVYVDDNCFDNNFYPAKACINHWDEHKIKLKVPAGGGASNGAINGGVWIEVGELLSNSLGFTVLSPHINWVSPEKGGAGQPITIKGANFGNSQGKVYFVDKMNHQIKKEAIFPCEESWRDDQIIIKVPEGPALAQGEYYLQVLTQDGHYSNVKDFLVNNQPPGPLICQLDPECGLVGEPVIISGEKFGSSPGKVYFGDKEASIDSWAPLEIKTKVPLGIRQGWSLLKVKIGESESNALSFSSPCGIGEPCDTDITTLDCDPGACSGHNICNSSSCICQAEHCFNGIKDPDEQGIDCGGIDCDLCGKTCEVNADCSGGQECCLDKVCRDDCNVDGSCAEGQSCPSGYTCCSDKICRLKCSCQNNNDCSGGQKCCPDKFCASICSGEKCQVNLDCNPNLVSVPGLTWEGGFEEDIKNWRMGGQINSLATIENIETYGGGKAVYIHQDPDQDYPGRCNEKTCNNLNRAGSCTWLSETKQCRFNGGDQCKGWTGPVFYSEGETLCWGNTNRVMWVYLTYNTVPLKLESGQTYTYSFYYKGRSTGNLNMSLSFNIGWSTQCVPESYANGYYCDSTKNPGFGQCENQPGYCCVHRPYQKRCYPGINLGAVPAGNYSQWTKFTKTFVYTEEMSQTLDRNGNLQNEIGMSMGYNSTGPLGTDLFVDNITLEKGSTNLDLICCNQICLSPNQCRFYLPRINSISPTNGMVKDPVTTYVTISGRNFGQQQGSGKVYFGTKEASTACQVWSDTEIIVAAPFGINGSVPIKVITSEGESNTKDFTVNNLIRPCICILTPNHGKAGDRVTISGINFGDQQINDGYKSQVLFENIEASVNSWSNNKIEVTVPGGITIRDPKVRIILKWKEAPAGTESNEVTFYMDPFITSLTPDRGPVDTYVTIRGGNFGSQPGRVTFNGIQANLAPCEGAWSDREIIVLASDSTTGPVVVKVTLPNGDKIESNKDKIFTYNNDPLAPGICLDKTMGAVADPVEIQGNKLGETIMENEGVTFNQVQAVVSLENPDNWKNYKIDTNVPQTSSGDVLVTKIGQRDTGEKKCVGGIYILGFCIGGIEEPIIEEVVLKSNPVWFEVGPYSIDLPLVTDYSPKGTNACRNVIVSATFNQLMDQGSLNSSTIIVEGVEGTVSYNDNKDNKTVVVFTPNGDLNPKTVYQVTIKKEVKNQMGKTMKEDKEWSFTTGDIFCKIDKVEINPCSYTFYPARAKEDFFAQAYDKNNTKIQASYFWQADDPDDVISEINNPKFQTQMITSQKGKTGQAVLRVQTDAYGGSEADSANIGVSLCERLWPVPTATEPYHPYRDEATKFETSYCRDR